jgi:hypothetical protein
MLASCVSLALLAAAPRVVMPEWTRVEVSSELATFYADQLAHALRENGLEVVTAAELATLLGLERQKQLLGCSADTQSCLAELGNALGADGTLVVSLAKLDDSFRANLKVLSTRTGAVLTETRVDVNGQRQLLDGLSAAAVTLAGAFKPKADAASKAPPSVSRFALAPALVAAALAVTGGIFAGLAKSDLDKLDDPTAVTTYSQALTVQSHGEGMQTAMWVAFSLSAACAVASVLLYVLGAAP